MKKAIYGVGIAALTTVGTAYAEVPSEVTTALDNVKADITTVGAALVVLAAAVMGFRWLKAQFF